MPSDEAFIVAIKKDDKKESQLEVLATKWTKCDDSKRANIVTVKIPAIHTCNAEVVKLAKGCGI